MFVGCMKMSGGSEKDMEEVVKKLEDFRKKSNIKWRN